MYVADLFCGIAELAIWVADNPLYEKFHIPNNPKNGLDEGLEVGWLGLGPAPLFIHRS